jgi:hypothetical protein
MSANEFAMRGVARFLTSCYHVRYSVIGVLTPVGSLNGRKIGRVDFLNWLHKPKEENFSHIQHVQLAFLFAKVNSESGVLLEFP